MHCWSNLKAKNSQRWYFAWENLLGDFYFHFDVHFVSFCFHFCSWSSFCCHLSMFFIYFYFSASSLTLPWTITRCLDPFYTFSPAHCRVIRNTFIFNHSEILLPQALRFWVDVLCPQACFTLRSLLRYLAQPAFIKVFPGSRQFFLEVCRASLPGPFVCLNHGKSTNPIFWTIQF